MQQPPRKYNKRLKEYKYKDIKVKATNIPEAAFKFGLFHYKEINQVRKVECLKNRSKKSRNR